jgi:chemotaxis protein MotB
MAEDTKPIIVKRVKKVTGGHHGGAWKIAYADFVTAMMAFFLLMWLLGSTAKGDLQGISEYFKTPLKIAMAGGDGSGASDSVLKGGGNNITKKQGQVTKKEEEKQKEKKPDLKSAQEAVEKAEMEKLEALKKRIEDAIASSATLSKFKNQLLIDITSEGLRIQIVDDQNRPMFASAKAELQPYAKQILHELGGTLNGVSNKISLSGHTDAVPYPTGEKYYSNWELSSDRANASRRELIAGGMEEDKLLRVVGLASAVLFDKANPTNPINRRISIIIMNKKTEQDIIKDDASVNVSSEDTSPDISAITAVQH